MARSVQRLIIGDEPSSWAAAGFDVDGDKVTLGKTTLELVGAEGRRGICGWVIDGVTTDIDGLPTVVLPEFEQPTPVTHRNMVFAVDHVVVSSPDPARTSKAFSDVDIAERKQRSYAGPDGVPHEQRFFWAGRVIIELMGPTTPRPGVAEEPAKFWGLALASANLEVASQELGDLLSEPKDAVQPGRKISTLRTKDLDISVPIALLSPHVANLGEPSETGSAS